MTARRTGKPPQLTLDSSIGLGRVRVGMEPFFEFSFWLAEELEDFVRRGSRRGSRVTGQRPRPLPQRRGNETQR